jgi:two-component system nitrogen regulation sensor histidine kinase NtrY
LLGLPNARCFGRSARELGLEELLAAPDQSHSLLQWTQNPSALAAAQGGLPPGWRAPHAAAAGRCQPALQEEEQIAWKRLIRVLGHELSNSLAPIKSIAGSLLRARRQLDGDDATLRDFRRGLGVSRAAPTRCIALCSRTGNSPSCPRRNSGRFSSGRCWSAWCCSSSACRFNSIPVRPPFFTPIPTSWSRCSSTCWPTPWMHRWPTDAQPVRASWKLAGSSATVTIEDRGLGIANSENLFVPFYTTKPTGSGVGLALAQQIARAHGGEIQLVNREDGEGARANPTATSPRISSALARNYHGLAS